MHESRNVTVRLPKGLLHAANIVAAVEGTSLRALFERSIQAELEKQVRTGRSELAVLVSDVTAISQDTPEVQT